MDDYIELDELKSKAKERKILDKFEREERKKRQDSLSIFNYKIGKNQSSGKTFKGNIKKFF